VDDPQADATGTPEGRSHPPLGTLFEDTALPVLDGFVVELMDRLDESEASMADRHTNLE
jgi:D-arabinose 5-phosphate isomerase GutQ